MANEKIRADWSALTEKQKTLTKEYMKTGKKLTAYKTAYYPNGVDPNKTKSRSVEVNCYRAFQNPKIAVVIEQIQQKSIEMSEIKIDDIIDETIDDLVEVKQNIDALQIDALWVLKRAALLADFNINKFIKVRGGNAVYDFSEATDDDWYCISEYSVDEIARGSGEDVYDVERIKIKSPDKLRALELVGKHINVGAFKEKLELSGDEANPIQTITRRIIKSGEKE